MDTSTRRPGRQFSSRPRSQAREHAFTVNCFYGPLFSHLKRHQWSIAEDWYLSDPHSRVHRVFSGRQHQLWQRDWCRNQCVMVAQVCTGHWPLALANMVSTCTISGAGTCHTVTAPMKQSSIWCCTVRPTIRPGGTRSQETVSQPIHDAFGATWNGLGQ